MKYFILLCLSFFMFIPVSQADIHLEPYGGAGISYSHSSERKLFMSYMGGVRLGYSFSLISAGLDLSYHHHRLSNSYTIPSVVVHQPAESKGLSQARDNVSIQYSSSGGSSFNPFLVGAFVGIDLPLFFDFYGAAFMSFFGKKDNLAMTGYGLKAGISYLSLPFIDLNAEVQWAYYRGGETAVSRDNFQLLSVLLSVSVPLSFDAGFLGGDRKTSSTEKNENNEESEEPEVELEPQSQSLENFDSY